MRARNETSEAVDVSLLIILVVLISTSLAFQAWNARQVELLGERLIQHFMMTFEKLKK